ncbi:MAG: SRPBCC family protein [Methanosarcinaceae archaeon]|nr:SRPBCC family protein [Methanosarcinaceae archaeon]
MLKAEVVVERSPEIVWDYFTKPKNWEKWWGGELRKAKWDKGGELKWANGNISRVIAINPAAGVLIDGGMMINDFTFEAGGAGNTIISIKSMPKGGAIFSDGGASHQAKLNVSLHKLKTHIEIETKENINSLPKSVSKSWKFWK